MTDNWKSFWFGTAAAIVIAVIAALVLQEYAMSSGAAFSTANTRI